MKTSRLFLAAALLGASALSASASSAVGFSSDPMGDAWDRGQAGTAFAQWDIFNSYTIVDDAPDSLFSVTNALLNQAGDVTGNPSLDQGAGTYGVFGSGMSATPGDKLIYSGNRPLIFNFAGTVAFEIKGFTLQVKRISSSSGTQSLFYVRLNGKTPDAAVTVSGAGDTETNPNGIYSTTTYYWGESLANSTDMAFNVEFGTISPANNRVALDTISVDAGSVAAVPEPSAAAMLLGGAGLLAMRRRRFARA